MTNEILSLSVTFAVCKLTILINGFPVIQESTSSSTNQQYPINQYLVEGVNHIILRIDPASSLGILNITGAQARGDLKIFQEGQVVTPEDGEKLNLTPHEGDTIDGFEISEALSKHLDPTKTLEMTYSFDCSISDFSNRFLKSPIIEEQDTVKAYAEKIRDILADKNAPALLEELAPKISDQAKAYYQDECEFKQMFTESFISGYLEKPFQLKWTADDLELIPWCDGRFYEIKVHRNSILDNIRNPKDGWMTMPCFVSLVDGKLKVTR